MPDSLAGLEGDYQVLTELYRTGASVTYLARHLHLARDVTITVVPAVSEIGKTDLKRVESDIQTLIALRHPNIVPVLEGRWIESRSFIVVRARVRGSTLDQLLSAIGPVPLARVKSTLEQVHAALGFARSHGVSSRHIAPESLVFQQGSGRVLVSFDSPPHVDKRRNADDAVTDARMIGRLARAMLSGRQDAGEEPTSLAELCPDLPSRLAGAADELAIDGTEPDVIPFFSALATAAGIPDVPTIISPTSSATPITPTQSVDAVRRVTAPRKAVGPSSVARVVTPVDAGVPANEHTPVPSAAAARPRRLGTRARWVIGIGVAMVLVAAGTVFVLQSGILLSVSSGAPVPDSAALASGDVAKKPIASPPVAAPVPVAAADTTHRDSTGAAADTTKGVTPPPADTAAKPVVPAGPPVSAPPSNVTANAACASALPADQRKCFSDAVQRADADLGRVYNALIAALRRQANSAPDDPDPPSVEKVRAAQRAWLGERDRVCQVVGAGIFSGRDRGQCFADRAAKRSRDLQLALDSVPPGS